MRRGHRGLKLLTLALAAFAAGVYLNNAAWLAPKATGASVILAHRGVGQTFTREGLSRDTCTASRIDPPRHDLIENTLPSMQAAFDAGADVVEFDVHPTTDGHFVVFHDWTLDCRTNGSGVTREHALPELQALDAGYGYTADGGATHPLRGKGVGLIPSLDEVLRRFPDRRFLINVKSNDPEEGRLLAAVLAELPASRRSLLMAYGGGPPIAALKQRFPDLPIASRATLKSCLIGYIALGWSGHVPSACHGNLLLVPVNVAPWLWGWPDRFLDRMRRASAQVFVLGPYDGEFSTGIDTVDELARLPDGFAGGVWTNRVETVAPLLRARAVKP